MLQKPRLQLSGTLCLVIATLAVAPALHAAPELHWTKSITLPDTTTLDIPFGIGADASGNVYMVGESSTGVNGIGAFVAKFDGNGELLWSRLHHAPPAKLVGIDVEIDSNGDVLVLGTTFDGHADSWLAKYTSQGLLRWSTTYHDPLSSRSVRDMDIDGENNVYVVGCDTHGDSFLMLEKFDANGNLVWRVNNSNYPVDWTFPYVMESTINGVCASDDGVWVAGSYPAGSFMQRYSCGGLLQSSTFYATLDGGPFNRIERDYNGNLFISCLKDKVLKCSAEGVVLTSGTISGSTLDWYPDTMALDGDGNLYTITLQAVPEGRAPDQAIFSKRTNDLKDVWRSLAGFQLETGPLFTGICVAQDKYVYAAGSELILDRIQIRLRKYLDAVAEADALLDPVRESHLRLAAQDSLVRVTVPAGTFPTVTRAVMQYLTDVPAVDGPGMRPLVGVSIELDDPSPVLQQDISITFQYEEAAVAGADRNNLVVARLDEECQRWIELPSLHDASVRSVTATTQHLSRFYLVEKFAGSGTGERRAICYPCPFEPTKGHVNMAFPVGAGSAALEVYTLTGELVFRSDVVTPERKILWDGKNGEGRNVASGVYPFIIRNEHDGKAVGKLAIIR